jgi:hypothetical protein
MSHFRAMPNQPITVRLPSFLLDRLEAYVIESGSSKTDVVIAALSQYLGVSTKNIPLSEKVAHLEKRLMDLERRID